MNKMKIKIFAFLGLILTFSLTLSSCDSLWDDLNNTPNVTITYVSDHGTVPEAKTVEPGYKLTADDLITLTETGYNFKGWDKSVGDTISADTTITASWVKTWTVSFSSNTGTGSMEPQIFEENVPQALSENKFTKDGYTFAGWATTADATEKEYADKANFTATKDTTLYAIWNVIPPAPKAKYTITYTSTYGTKPANKEVEEGYQLTAADLPDLGETDDKYFDKWDKTVGTEITAATTINAVWEPIVYFDKSKITTYKNTAENIIFTTDSYTGTGTTFDCASGSNPEYFTGVLDGTTLTIYGKGRRIYAPENCQGFFSGFSKITNIEFNNFYTSKVTNMQQMFLSCKLLVSLDLSSFDTSAVTNMSAMFGLCNALSSLDISSFNTSNVTNMAGMFNGLNTITELNLSNFDTSKVTDINSMFSNCENLTSVNLSSFNTSCVQYMYSMFNNCKALETLDVSKFKTSAVLKMSGMFSSCEKLKELDLSGFNTSAVTEMANMFSSCKALKELDLSSFTKGTNLSKIHNMFENCTALEKIYVNSSFDLSEFTENNEDVFNNCEKLSGGAGTTYDSSKIDNTYARIDEGTSNPGYFTEKK